MMRPAQSRSRENVMSWKKWASLQEDVCSLESFPLHFATNSSEDPNPHSRSSRGLGLAPGAACPGFLGCQRPSSGADWTPLSAKLDSGPQPPPGTRQVMGVAVLHLYLQDFCSSPEDSQAQVSRASTARARVFLTPARPCSSSRSGAGAHRDLLAPRSPAPQSPQADPSDEGCAHQSGSVFQELLRPAPGASRCAFRKSIRPAPVNSVLRSCVCV